MITMPTPNSVWYSQAEGHEGTEVYCIWNTLWWLLKDSSRLLISWQCRFISLHMLTSTLKISVDVQPFKIIHMATGTYGLKKLYNKYVYDLPLELVTQAKRHNFYHEPGLRCSSLSVTLKSGFNSKALHCWLFKKTEEIRKKENWFHFQKEPGLSGKRFYSTMEVLLVFSSSPACHRFCNQFCH